MRELNECKAEVLRRSEKRIKERKKARNRILTLCIPLCLILSVWSVTIFQDKLSVGMDSAGENMEYIGNVPGEEAYEDIVEGKHIYVSVEVKREDEVFQITDSSSVTRVYECVFLAFEADGAGADTSGTSKKENAEQEDALKGSISETKETQSIRISLYSNIDGARVYVLEGRTLYDENFDREVLLTQAQWNDLMVALELADY